MADPQGGFEVPLKRKRSNLQKRRLIDVDMGVSKNGGTPKWMVYNGNPY